MKLIYICIFKALHDHFCNNTLIINHDPVRLPLVSVTEIIQSEIAVGVCYDWDGL